VPPRKKPAAIPPLTEADVADLAFRVKGGDTPRVVVRSGSAALPAGTRGNVIRIGKPSEGEYIVVRLGRDEVPFAPSELSIPTRGRGAATTPAASGSAAKRTAAAATRPATKTAPTKSTPSRSATGRSAARSATTGRAAATKTTRSGPAKTAPATSAAPSSRRATKRTSRRGKGRTPQPLTVTLRFSDSRWTVEAQRGSRRITKAMPLRPGAVSAFAEHVDEQAVREALIETVESCRAVVEEQAALLRAELQAAESALQEYDARRR
jgi:hypothetical protein